MSDANSIYRYDQVREVHLEVTSRCNAACPMCARNIRGGIDNPHLPLADMSVADAQRIFEPSFIRQLTRIYMCGNYGDPGVAPDSLPILNYFRDSNKSVNLGIHTNGSCRNPKWWSELAGVVDYCQFGIDGLEDTNHIYRRNTKWSQIMENAGAFIAAGGKAEWAFLVFLHNEHQVEQARKLSVELGFKRFIVRRTNRFLRGDAKRSTVQVEDRKGQVETTLEPTTRKELLNPGVEALVEISRESRALTQYYDQCAISCMAEKDRRIYVSAEGYVFPCCYTGHVYTANGMGNQISRMLDKLQGGWRSINAKHSLMREIVEGAFFHDIAASWSKNSMQEGRLRICSEQCGTIKPTTTVAYLGNTTEHDHSARLAHQN